MKCSVCVDELLKRAKKEVGRDKDQVESQIMQELPALKDAVTAGRGGAYCLRHYIERNSW
jgi:hypothetical protein